jgi:hypothetical protein
MKDSLDDFIRNHRDAFDDKEPDEKVWNRIEANLPGAGKLGWNSLTMWRMAAMLFMGLSLYLFIDGRPDREDQKVAKQLQGEFMDLESYYAKEIAKKVALIDEYDAISENDQFTQDLEKLDAMYQVLRDELKVAPSEKVKDALILNILVRLDLLNQQIKKLEDQSIIKSQETSV